jgi:hypothetical protein
VKVSHIPCRLEDYLNWKAKYQEVYRKYIDLDSEDSSSLPVKVAVLDSGVDDTHNALDTGQIRIKRNWTSKHPKRTYDRDGHGTFTASLVIDYCPDVELYIAKVAEEAPCPPNVIADVSCRFIPPNFYDY